MKELLKSLLIHTGLLPVWNRCLGGNRMRNEGAHNKIQVGKSLLTRTTIHIRGDGNSLRVGNGCRFRDLKIILTGNSLRVEISDNCQMRGKIKVEDAGSQVTIGAGTTMENTYLGACEGAHIRIGNDCMFSDQVGLRTGDMHSIIDAETGTRQNPARPITIEPRVWLCRGVTVLKGCTIGENTVVGGGAMVTESLPAGILAVGSPARIIRTGIRWRRERIAMGSSPSAPGL
jgi:acetyltransferase-like isoleucine patch superfamily enzyme